MTSIAKPRVARDQEPARIVVRGVNWLGDAVMTTPALQRLHEHWPAASITMLAPRKLVELWRHHPHVHAVLAMDQEVSMGRLARRLREEAFDLALVLPNSPRSALEMFLARIPRRVGHARPWRNLLLTDAVAPRAREVRMRKRSPEEIQALIRQETARDRPPEPSPASHHIFQYLHLVEALGGNGASTAPLIHVTDQELAEAREAFLTPEHETRGWVGLNPGAEYGPAKRWPAERFADVALEVHRTKGQAVVLLGGPGDQPITAAIRRLILHGNPALPVLDLAGRTSLRQLAALCKLCRCLVTNDSGPMHLAAAVGARVVALFGSTSPALTGPGDPMASRASSKIQVLWANAACSPCFLKECPIDFRCMTRIQVGEVVAALHRAMA